MKRVGVLLVAAALIGGMACCIEPPPRDREIWDWHDLHAVRLNLNDNYHLMNDLDTTTAGYEALASPTANEGKGWEPIGTWDLPFTGELDGQGYEIRDLFAYRPDQDCVGLFGRVYPGLIENVGVVNATVTGKNQVGGLVGDICKTTVRTSYSSGNVTGAETIGGLVGQNSGRVIDSYSTATVTGNTGVGGLAGTSGYGYVSNSYSTGNVAGDSDAGGLVGLNTGHVGSSFWDIQTSGQTTSAGGTGKTTTEMQEIGTFSGAGWNITAVANPDVRNSSYTWNMVDNETYPFLSWQPTS